MYMLHIFFCGGHTRRVWDYVLHTNGRAFSFFYIFYFRLYISLVCRCFILPFCHCNVMNGTVMLCNRARRLVKTAKGVKLFICLFSKRVAIFFRGYFFTSEQTCGLRPPFVLFGSIFFALERSGCCVLLYRTNRIFVVFIILEVV